MKERDLPYPHSRAWWKICAATNDLKDESGVGVPFLQPPLFLGVALSSSTELGDPLFLGVALLSSTELGDLKLLYITI